MGNIHWPSVFAITILGALSVYLWVTSALWTIAAVTAQVDNCRPECVAYFEGDRR